MTVTRHEAYMSPTAALGTGLNSLANNANSAESSAIDNTSNKELFFDVELNLAVQGGARSTGAYVSVFMTIALDGTNYTRAHETTAEWVCDFPLDAATTATRATRRNFDAPASLVKFFARNSTGQAFAASGNEVEVTFHSLENT